MKPSENILTIAIPTRNRSEHLDRLLEHLSLESLSLCGRMRFIVSDNSSNDNTPSILQKYSNHPQFKIYSHKQPLHVDQHFHFLHSQACTDYFWMLADDDMPSRSFLARLVSDIDQHIPSCIFLDPLSTRIISQEWESFNALSVSRHIASHHFFLRYTSYMLPFISSFIVRRSLPSVQPVPVNMPAENLEQLKWIFPAVSQNGLFLIYKNAILCTSANSGGYNPVTVFGRCYTNCIRSYFADNPLLLRCLLYYHLRIFLPELIYNWMHNTRPVPSARLLHSHIHEIYYDNQFLRKWVIAIFRCKKPLSSLLVLTVLLFKFQWKLDFYTAKVCRAFEYAK